MPRVLLAADADRVQELVFRCTRLREAVGGSHALEAFWRGAADHARHAHGAAAVPVAAGGALRVLFDGPDAPVRADRFGRDVQDLYAMRMGGRLTVAQVAGEGGDAALFAALAAEMGRAKAAGDPPAASVFLPYLRPCDACGLDPAEGVYPSPGGGGGVDSLCRTCRSRARHRDDFRAAFRAALEEAAAGDPRAAAALEATGDAVPEAEDVGRYDPRGRVAYLLADGDGFGARFRAAVERGGVEALSRLSARVAEAGADAVRRATLDLLRIVEPPPAAAGARPPVPVLPLITGGDDLFLLLPAPWAVWFASRLARHFAAALPEEAPTLGMALVLCKAEFPYRFAHGAGEEALRAAKAVARSSPGRSLLRAVEVREADPSPAAAAGAARAIVADAPENAPTEPGLVAAGALLDARRALDWLPGKRRHQLEALLRAPDAAEDGGRDRLAWAIGRAVLQDPRADDLAARLARLDPHGGPGGAIELFDLWDYLHAPAAEEAPR